MHVLKACHRNVAEGLGWTGSPNVA